ncbi:penicillin acylase family protein [Labrys wisconsinensis]|uniref:Penicillin amidase n=1 Tax=Labrys wisconsinensis TaxID=425677 RepID=A0ABU0JBT4_9HYPH|nr:penicillin acylase family protein [Labrys wisconsinensis]MDQ0471738.1 penicillin amidase [Labrys wisconsinensis]
MPSTTRHTLPGLEQPASIVVDRWGVPHIRARSRRDAFFVQGFNAARDRLWQIDLWRKRGLGLLAADFGPGYLAQDRACRLFLYRGDMAAEWAAYGVPDAQAITEAFVAGINAYVGLTEADPSLLPPEFGALGTRPARWRAEDVVRIRSHALSDNAPSELARARVMALADADTDELRQAVEPKTAPVIPDGLDLAALAPEALDLLALAKAPAGFPPERLAATLDEAGRWAKVVDGRVARAEGSNNWVLAPARTATGRPILASDPHRAYSLPSLRYVAHLQAPGLDVIGAGEPALPGISIGHNGTAAFGLTIFPTDQEDVYVYDTDPDDPHRYRHGADWEAMRVIREAVAVKGAPEQQAELKFTRHGPVVFEDRARRKAYAVRTVWLEPGSAAYFASLAYQAASSLGEFEAALAHWSVPPVNQVYADTSGAIGWIAAAKAPRRPNWNGLLPVPGDGRFEWDGFLPAGALPRALNPAAGFVFSANQMNLPPDFPQEQTRLGHEWLEPSRADRIAAVLAPASGQTLADAMALQTDTLSLPAARVCALLPAELPGPAAALLAGWDRRLDAASPAALLFEVWWHKHLGPAVLDRAAADPAVRALLGDGDVASILDRLERPDPGRDVLLAATLEAAFAECVGLMGADAASWAWGRLHHGFFEHALDRRSDVGPLPVGGSGSTVMNTHYRLPDFRAVTGASFRMVVDVGAWDESRFINAPGQSGDPRSPHYADLAPTWAAGEYLPLAYSREAVDAAAESIIELEPATATQEPLSRPGEGQG